MINELYVYRTPYALNLRMPQLRLTLRHACDFLKVPFEDIQSGQRERMWIMFSCDQSSPPEPMDSVDVYRLIEKIRRFPRYWDLNQDSSYITLPNGLPSTENMIEAAIHQMLGDPRNNIISLNIACDVYDEDVDQWIPAELEGAHLSSNHFTVRFAPDHLPTRYQHIEAARDKSVVTQVEGAFIRVRRDSWSSVSPL